MKQQLFRLLPMMMQQAVRRWHYQRKFAAASSADEKDLLLVARIVATGDVVFDIGANFGLYTKILAEAVGPKGTVYSFEPVPQTYDVLVRNLRRAGLDHVQPLCYAASDVTGTALISIPTYADGSDNMYGATLEQADGSTGLQISTLRLDERFADLSQLNVVKLDVEGHEPQVLEGMRSVIARHYPAFLIEINDGFDENSIGAQVHAFMTAMGYSMYYFDGSELRRSYSAEEGVNYLFIHSADERTRSRASTCVRHGNDQ